MTRSYYIGPRRPRLQLDTWDEVVNAAGSGSLDETHWVELKVAVPAAGPSANLELARDLASLSVDGGLLVIGIEDGRGKAGRVVGTDPHGIESRIPQVAAMRIDPPLSVVIDIIPKPDNPQLAVVVVTVPASADAPHMADNKYWGRTTEGKRSLADVEIRRLMAERKDRGSDFENRLRTVKEQLEVGGRVSRYGRLYLLAEPTMPAREQVSDLTAGRHILDLIVSGLDFRPPWSPGFTMLNHGQYHPAGRLGSSVPFSQTADSGEDYLGVLLGDDGSVSVSAPAVRRRIQQGMGSELCIIPGQVVGTVHNSLALTRYIAQEFTGYAGSYNVGLHITNLRRTLPTEAFSEVGFMEFLPYPTDDYLAMDRTTTRELQESTPSVVQRLTRRLLRSFQVEARYLPYEHPSELLKRG